MTTERWTEMFSPETWQLEIFPSEMTSAQATCVGRRMRSETALHT